MRHGFFPLYFYSSPTSPLTRSLSPSFFLSRSPSLSLSLPSMLPLSFIQFPRVYAVRKSRTENIERHWSEGRDCFSLYYEYIKTDVRLSALQGASYIAAVACSGYLQYSPDDASAYASVSVYMYLSRARGGDAFD